MQNCQYVTYSHDAKSRKQILHVHRDIILFEPRPFFKSLDDEGHKPVYDYYPQPRVHTKGGGGV